MSQAAPNPSALTPARSNVALLARVGDPATGALLVPADVGTATLVVTDAETGQSLSRDLDVAATVHDVPQPWRHDAHDHNVAAVLGPGDLPDPGTAYVAALTLDLVAGGSARQLWRIETYPEPTQGAG